MEDKPDTQKDVSEPILTPEKDRFTILPIRYPKVWEAYKQQEAAIWHVQKVDLSKDLKDWVKMTKDEQHFIKTVLAFFAASDVLILQNLAERFIAEIQPLEIKFGYAYQAFMENIHSEMYSLLIDTYITDAAEKEFLFNAIKNIPIVGKKADWALKWMRSQKPFCERLVAFSAVEGIFFSGSFCAIYWLRQRGVMHGLCESNDYIARDEGMHTDFAVLLHEHLKNPCPQETLHAIIREAVDLEVEFITEALPCRLVGMNATDMAEYIRFVANRLVLQYGYEPIFPKAKNPFPFMERGNLQSKKNFFERNPTEYNKGETKRKSDVDPYSVC